MRLSQVRRRIASGTVAYIVVGDLHTAVNQGIHSRGAYHLVVIHRLLCGGRGIIFAGVGLALGGATCADSSYVLLSTRASGEVSELSSPKARLKEAPAQA